MKQKSIAVDLWVYLFNFNFMKLFITNKKEFEEQFNNKNCCSNVKCKRDCLTSGEIHKKLFNQLSLNLTIKHSIPLVLTEHYDKGDGIAVFDFITKKDDIYYYQFSCTAS